MSVADQLMTGQMPHDTSAKREAVVVSRASSRRELARIVVTEIVPAMQGLQHNDRVTQDVCKSIIATYEAISKQLETFGARLTAIEDKLGITKTEG